MACFRGLDAARSPRRSWTRALVCALAAGLAVVGVAGCASLAQSAAGDFANNLSQAILNQDDPELVREGLPAYLLALDALAAKPDASPTVLGAAAQLYAAYAVVFVNDAARAAGLATRARNYGVRALCAADRDACGIDDLDFAAFEELVARLAPADADALLSYAVGALAYVRTHADDFEALADLPRIETALTRLLVIGGPKDAARVNTYLGVLTTLRPPALGGQPERGKAYFEKALELTQGRDLSVLVEYAQGYARLVYDRPLYDRLLNEALKADPRQPGYTLFNTLAQRQATELLASADDYF
jgi:hypothetical protein